MQVTRKEPAKAPPNPTSPALLQSVGERRNPGGDWGGEVRAEDVGAVLRDGAPSGRGGRGDEEDAAHPEAGGARPAGQPRPGGALGRGQARTVALGRS